VHQLERLTAPALRELIDRGVTSVIVPFGSTEHQGGHLPVGADSMVADAVAREVAERLDAVLAPGLRVGCADQHEDLPGTLTLNAKTLTMVAIELARTLTAQGFLLVVLLSAHGGNRAALDAAVAELDRSLEGAAACAPQGDVGPHPGRHSGAWLTSVMLALHPDLVDLERADPDLREELQTAAPERGDEALERFVASIVRAAGRGGATLPP
jgi:creatinine amidohydrolase